MQSLESAGVPSPACAWARAGQPTCDAANPLPRFHFLFYATPVPAPADSGCPCFKSRVAAVQGLKKRFHLALPEPQVWALFIFFPYLSGRQWADGRCSVPAKGCACALTRERGVATVCRRTVEGRRKA